MRVLITGGCGFIGHHVVEHFHRHTKWDIVVIDKLSYASFGLDRLRDSGLINSPRITILTVDLVNSLEPGIKQELGNIEMIFHLAADTHVDNSISQPIPFVINNIKSTLTVLEYARELPSLKRLFYFSTDEVYGPAPPGFSYTENDKHNPTNPYSASKSASEQLCRGYMNTYDIPLIIINVMNVFGERQHIEKFIPMCIKAITSGDKINIHTYPGTDVPGTRYYIHARNVADALLFISRCGNLGEQYNITGEQEVDNLTLAKAIAGILGKDLNFELDPQPLKRPGHDPRYALDGTKLKELGWEPPVTFQSSLSNTVLWTLENDRWLEDK